MTDLGIGGIDVTEYRGYDEIKYRILRKKIDKLFNDWWHCHDNKQAKVIFDEYLAAVHAASEVAPPVARVWRMEHENK